MTGLSNVTNLMQLADNMAAAATTFNSHGYDAFISAREELKNYISEIMHDSSIGLGQRPFTS